MVDLYPERCEHSHISVDGHCLKCGIATSDIYFCDQKK